MSWDRFVELRNTAPVLGKMEHFLGDGEMNPSILIKMIAAMKSRGLSLDVWEQFSSPESARKFWKIAKGQYACIESWGMRDCDDVVGYVVRDSTMEWPDRLGGFGLYFGGVLMHPPYFGSSVMSENSNDLSVLKDKEEYKRRLWAAFRTASRVLQVGGLACTVVRRYRFGGEEIELDRWAVELGEAVGFTLEEVWSSCPDIVILFRWR